MNSNLQSSKSILAKLLAAENITVSHQNIKTAMFNLKTRTLVCPVWKDMDGHLYDLLMGHEVGHALNTPEAGWHSAIHDENGKPLGKFKDFLNVIEDARIERQVKRKFPGLAKSFATAYKSLYDRDFFGIKNIDANKLNLIDRINIRYKMGAHIPVAFSDDERVFLVDIDNAETWDQVVDVARRVYAYCKQQKEEQKSQINNMQDLQEELQQQFEEVQSEFQDFNDESDESDDDESDDDSDDDSDASDEDGTPEEDSADDSDYQDADEEDSEPNDGVQSASSEQEDLDESTDDDPESVTDRNFRRREDELVNQTGEVFMIELPEAVLENIILQNKFVMNDLESFIRKQVVSNDYGRHGISFETVAAKCVRKFNTNNKKFIMHILKEFEMRKKAADYARVQTAKTGELNMRVLHNYKFTNDLFKKISVVPKGKSHGMVMYVDMSGSMSDILRNTIEQCLVLVSFCRLAKIPFDVYGFSDDYYNSSDSSIFATQKFINSTENEGYAGHMRSGSFHLKHLIGSTLSPTDYRRSFANLCIVANEYHRGRGLDYNDKDHGRFDAGWDEAGFGLNGTPFQQTLLASRDMINNFRAKHKLDIVNVIYLTDGEGGEGIQMPWTRNGVYYLVDKKTKKKIRSEGNVQAALTQLVRDVTGCKHLGFFLATKNDVSRVCKDLEYVQKIDLLQSKNFKKQFREEKFVAIPNLGYDKYFYIQSAAGSIQEDEMSIDGSMSKNKMANEFSRSVNSKKTSRALVTQFAEEISASLKWAA